MKHSIFIITAGCLWGIIAVFISILNKLGFDALQCVAIRAFLAAVILFIYIAATDREKLRIKLKDLIWFVGTGIGSIVFFNYCYFKAIEMIGGAAIPALLLYTAPIFVVLLSAIFFREKITFRKIAALLMTFAGLGFVTGAFTGGERVSFFAFLLGLGSGFGYALYSIFGKFVVEKYDAVTITFYTFLIAAIGVTPVSGVAGEFHRLWNMQGILAAGGLAFFSTVLPFLLYTRGLKGVEAGKASILATIEPFVAAIAGAVFFQETFTVEKITGMILIIFAIVFLNTGSGKEPPEEKGVKKLSIDRK